MPIPDVIFFNDLRVAQLCIRAKKGVHFADVRIFYYEFSEARTEGMVFPSACGCFVYKKKRGRFGRNKDL
jgi:hypothetical protein